MSCYQTDRDGHLLPAPTTLHRDGDHVWVARFVQQAPVRHLVFPPDVAFFNVAVAVGESPPAVGFSPVGFSPVG